MQNNNFIFEILSNFLYDIFEPIYEILSKFLSCIFDVNHFIALLFCGCIPFVILNVLKLIKFFNVRISFVKTKEN